MLLFVLRPSLAFSRLLDSLVLVGVLLKRRGPHYTHNFDSERETIMAANKIRVTSGNTPKKAAAKKGYKDGKAGNKARTNVIRDESTKSQRYSAAYKRGSAERAGAEGPKRSTPRTARTRKK